MESFTSQPSRQKGCVNRTKRDSLRRAHINLRIAAPPWTELGLFLWPKTGNTVPGDGGSKPKMRGVVVAIGQEGTSFRIVE